MDNKQVSNTWSISILRFLANLFNFFDSIMPSVIAEPPVRKEWGLDDTQLSQEVLMWGPGVYVQKPAERWWLIGVALSALLTWPATSHAQSPDPRDYEVGQILPSKSVIINTYLRQVSGIEGRDISAQTLALRATYLLKFGNLAITPFDATLPIQNVEVYRPIAALGDQFSAVPKDFKLSAHGTGMGDAAFLPSIALYIRESATEKTHTWIAATFYVSFPTGSYDKQRLLNAGANRWGFTPLLIVGQRFLRSFTLEALASAAFYGNNTEYRAPIAALAGVDLKLKQKPTINAAVHLAVDLHPNFYTALSYLVGVNGERTLDVPGMGELQESRSNTVHSLRLGLGMRVGPGTSILAQWQEDIRGSKGAALGRFFGLRIIHAFFGSNNHGAPAATTQPAAS